jgi:hypothetical protein
MTLLCAASNLGSHIGDTLGTASARLAQIYYLGISLAQKDVVSMRPPTFRSCTLYGEDVSRWLVRKV